MEMNFGNHTMRLEHKRLKISLEKRMRLVPAGHEKERKSAPLLPKFSSLQRHSIQTSAKGNVKIKNKNPEP